MSADQRHLLDQAADLVVSTQFGSINMVRRQLDISHARAQELMTLLEEHGVVGTEQHGRSRAVLVRVEDLPGVRTSWAVPLDDDFDERTES